MYMYVYLYMFICTDIRTSAGPRASLCGPREQKRMYLTPSLDPLWPEESKLSGVL